MAEKGHDRESWSSSVSFLLACVGYAVGLGNIWRFPYLCYKSGGGAFLIPYFIMLLFCGLPLLFMEIAVGQYTRQGPIGALKKICPILTGAGFATVVISFWLCSYYNVIISWALFYMIASFKDPLPWVGCDNEWNTPLCFNMSQNATGGTTLESSAQQYYDNRVLGMTESITDMGSIRWELFILLIIAWIVVYFCIWKSVKATGKVVYVTATVPVLLLITFLIRGVTLPGADIGLTFFFQPVWEKMLEAEVWVYAAAQVFNSIGIAFGSIIAFSSYNKFHGPILRNVLLLTLIDAAICIICGVAVFSTMGNLAYEMGLDTVEGVVSEGPGLVFVVFPQALSNLPLPQIWSVIFFAMLVMLGVDSQFATVEVIVTSVKDSGLLDKYFRRHEILVAVICFVIFLVGIPYIFEGGIYIFQLVDYYGSAISLMYIAFFECTAIVWLYGTKRLSSNVYDMTGSYPNWFFRFCWMFLSPLLIFAIWIFNLVDYTAPTYDGYVFPAWAHAMGWLVSMSSIIAIPIFAFLQILKERSTLKERLITSATSTIVKCPCGCGCDLDSNWTAHSSPISGLQLQQSFRMDEEDGGIEKS